MIIPESNRMFYLLEGLDKNKRFYTPNGIQSHLPLASAFDQRYAVCSSLLKIIFSIFSRDGCFECGQVNHLKILVQILLHSSPPIDTNRTGKFFFVVFIEIHSFIRE